MALRSNNHRKMNGVNNRHTGKAVKKGRYGTAFVAIVSATLLFSGCIAPDDPPAIEIEPTASKQAELAYPSEYCFAYPCEGCADPHTWYDYPYINRVRRPGESPPEYFHVFDRAGIDQQTSNMYMAIRDCGVDVHPHTITGAAATAKSAAKYAVVMFPGQQRKGFDDPPWRGEPNAITGTPDHWRIIDTGNLWDNSFKESNHVPISKESFAWKMYAETEANGLFDTNRLFWLDVLNPAYDFERTTEYKSDMADAWADFLNEKLDPEKLEVLVLAGSSRGGCLATRLGKKIKQGSLGESWQNVPIVLPLLDPVCARETAGTSGWDQLDQPTGVVDNPLESTKGYHGIPTRFYNDFDEISSLSTRFFTVVGGDYASGLNKDDSRGMAYYPNDDTEYSDLDWQGNGKIWYTQRWVNKEHERIGRSLCTNDGYVYWEVENVKDALEQYRCYDDPRALLNSLTGQCECPDGWFWDEEHLGCQVPCPEMQYFNWEASPPKCECQAGLVSTFTKLGTVCSCPDIQVWDPTVAPSGACVCPAGTSMSILDKPMYCKCSLAHQVYNTDTDSCECGMGYTYMPKKGICGCSTGNVIQVYRDLDGDGNGGTGYTAQSYCGTVAPLGYSTNTLDLDDAPATVGSLEQ